MAVAKTVTPEMRAAMERGGEWLRRTRISAGFPTVTAFAAALGIKQVRLSTYERGMYQVEPDIARRIARTLDLSELEVWRGLELPLPAALSGSASDRIRKVEELWPGLIDALVNNEPLPPRPDTGLPRQRSDKEADSHGHSSESSESA